MEQYNNVLAYNIANEVVTTNANTVAARESSFLPRSKHALLTPQPTSKPLPETSKRTSKASAPLRLSDTPLQTEMRHSEIAWRII